MWKGIHIVPPDTKFDFIGQRYIAFAITLAMILGSFYFVFDRGLSYGIDFTGGTLIEVAVKETPDLAGLREDLNDLELGEVSLQEFGNANTLLIRVPGQGDDPAVQKAAIDKVRGTIDEDYADADYRRVEFVGPQVGEELKKKGFYAVVFALLGIMAYVWARFEWQFGLAALISIAHDVIAVLGFMAFTGMTFDLSTLAAVLMVAGFSINDTVVIFDRIREIMRKYRKMPLAEVCNISINQTLSRTIMTSMLTLLALVALWIFGGEVIQGFVDALLFGFIVGTYSSVYVAASLLLYMRLRPEAEEKHA
ncbi:MAG TPA: protein translocase subunit SecF [Micavibrio sp.]|nr:protein translocase subunit SecF [Micavibrio sp.]